jgi:3-(3-hydroxy-phenyl)propionate hydroxylase
LLDSYDEERHEAAQQNVRVTNRTARFLRPAEGVEKLFREAALGLARQYVFARQLINTGRMAIANPYTHSSACDATGGQSVQNVDFLWPDNSSGTLNDLLEWAGGRLLLLVFGDASPQCFERLSALGETAPVRSVHVLGADEPAAVLEHVRDPHGHLQGACHVFGHAWALIRPDSYVAATGESVDSTLIHAVTKAIGASGEEP